MLVASQFVNYEHLGARTPRIISEVRKQKEFWGPQLLIRPRISGELLVLLGADRNWYSRRVMIRCGQLLLGQIQGESGSGMRIPLRQLSLRSGCLPHSLSLIKGQSILLTLQAINERSFDLWVKTIAIELIRQTPLEYVKYLDILNLTERKTTDCSATQQKNNDFSSPCYTCKSTIPRPEDCDINKNHVTVNGNLPVSSPPVDLLLKKCQNMENYVPVKEKLVLFESLCRLGRENGHDVVGCDPNLNTKRARSMHDLTYCFSTAGVREICKYFETKLDDSSSRTIVRKTKRLINSDSNLSKLRYNFENVSYA